MFCENNLFAKSTALTEDQHALSPCTFDKMLSFDCIFHFNELSVNLIFVYYVIIKKPSLIYPLH